MAKAKKSESKASAPKKKSAAKKPQQASGPPIIDTALAASNAAMMIGNKGAGSGAGNAPPRKESAAFKQLKEGLARPHSQVVGNLLDSTAGQKKSNLPFGGMKQVGRNQTYGADVTRSGVPRRNAG